MLGPATDNPPDDRLRRLTYMLARHVAAVDRVPASTWTLQGQRLLAELRDLAPGRFDREVPGRRRRAASNRR